jgi:hypothetical protein
MPTATEAVDDGRGEKENRNQMAVDKALKEGDLQPGAA